MDDLFENRLNQAAGAARAHLIAALDQMPPSMVREAMRHGVEGGKGLRAFLVMESAALFGIEGAQAVGAAAAVEAVHAYSLIHDDLPCMDDDDLRRGQPTVHVKWDEATAVLAGDALQTLAFELLAQDGQLDLISGLARASGAAGMVLGQAQDIAAETADVPLTLEQITELQAHKTGALIRWSATAGAVMAGADTGPLATYADALGLAFQITDDILDVEGETADLGKTAGKDARAGKATYVSLLGLNGAKSRAKELVELAQSALNPYQEKADILKQAARFVLERKA